MQIFIGADHGGFSLKEYLVSQLQAHGLKVTDEGAHEIIDDDDYPAFAFAVADQVAKNHGSLGILCCRSGGGMAIAANKVKGVRAVDVFDEASAIHARVDNHANLITLGADWLEPEAALQYVLAFLQAEPSTELRHVRRIAQITAFERQNL